MTALRKSRFSIRSVKTGDEITYDGYASKNFGVRMTEHGFWQVTHLPSQATINAWDSRSLKHLRSLVAEAETALDWSPETLPAIASANGMTEREVYDLVVKLKG